MDKSSIARIGILAAVSLTAFVIISCQRSKAPVESPEPRLPDWDSGLSIEMEFEVAVKGDTVTVTSVATATNVTKSSRDLCVNLHFVAGFQESQQAGGQTEPTPIEPTIWSRGEDVHEIALSPWKKSGKSNCTARSLAPGESFQERFVFKYSKAEFAVLKGDVYMMCEIWFQTRVDIPNQSLTCDMGRFGFEKVPGP
jgi:hypothetical protein